MTSGVRPRDSSLTDGLASPAFVPKDEDTIEWLRSPDFDTRLQVAFEFAKIKHFFVALFAVLWKNASVFLSYFFYCFFLNSIFFITIE